MARKQKLIQVFSESPQLLWKEISPSIWKPNSRPSLDQAALAIARLLLDQPRWLEPCYLYDERGSRLFEQICRLPEYYLTRSEEEILARHAAALMEAAPVRCLVELGSGSATKTRYLLEEQMSQRGQGIYVPIDVSLSALTASREMILRHYPGLAFHGLCARYEEGIRSIEKTLPTLFLFLGSSIGNFTRAEFGRFFATLAECMGETDFFLLGVDRVKPVQQLERAYNDSAGVTAEFILNVFHHINRLAGTNFETASMEYDSFYNPVWQQVEMYAVCRETQEIRFPSLGTSFLWKQGDRILVEISRKFDPSQLVQQLSCFGLRLLTHLADSNQCFSLLLFERCQRLNF